LWLSLKAISGNLLPGSLVVHHANICVFMLDVPKAEGPTKVTIGESRKSCE
jgi:hypothetical protein